MRQKQRVYQTFTIFALLSLVILIISPSSPVIFLEGIVEKVVTPIQQSAYANIGIKRNNDKAEIIRLREENATLLRQLAGMNALKKDNQALHDQFSQSSITSTQLLPAQIVGADHTLPGVYPTQITINKGKSHGVKEGMAIIYKDILIGTIVYCSNERSLVTLATNEKTTIPAKISTTGALGIVKGKGTDMVFEQVLVSENINQDDIVTTKGDMNNSGIGVPPDLIIGKITSIEKKPSALFQSARIESLVDVLRLTTVFVYLTQ